MSFTVAQKEKYSLVEVTAEKLDGQISPELKSLLVMENSKGVKNLVLDMSGARYCDSSGLSAVLVGNRLCNAAEGTFILSGVQSSVMKLISISQLDSILTILPTAQEAEDYLFMEEIERGLGSE
ncbi:STAS domain-containing protein [Flavobacteriales bacterium]|jgi:anti-anti-sigma factor|nr:STAS domain-containing protein [Flavobacteriales bacterium]